MNAHMQHRLSLSLYLNYFVHGIGLIILAQNMQSLGQLWHAPLATVSYVISGVGIGRLIAYLLLGILSDRYGRKNFVFLGMICYFVFFLGMLGAPNIQIAYLLAIIAGIANSALDSGTYTTFVELGGKEGASNVLIKAFMSLGEFVLPLFVASLENNSLWFGWSFILAASVLIINFFLLLPIKFPKANQSKSTMLGTLKFLSKPRKIIITTALALYGYTSMALMILFTQWITLYASETLHMGNVAAHFLLSLYSIGSISGVLIMFWLLRRQISELTLLVFFNIAALISLSIICFIHIAWLTQLASFVFGLTAASGVMQVGLNTFLKLYPQTKGLVTGIFFTFGSLASFTVPVITGWLSKKNIAAALEFDLLISCASLILVVIIRLTLGKQKTLAGTRRTISYIDKLIVRLLVRRFKAVDTIITFKEEINIPVLDSKREEKVLDNVADQCSNQKIIPYLQEIYMSIMASSRKYQENKRHNNK
ncbi:transport protein [Liquorilactobacillus aquaticus DSM 21051]|uniref:Transport protein n=1 Tax=Liquorilactobacillus aquaticus DSM 21051 TaxID=1423725 RepID=A0A0R2D059_9LACO|nr:MFS transporter [Liquorilactobacillus aquaticus]KRM96762.1 transport protein [Liquorilactobacillus aquaticus DSM 21051]